VDNKIIYLNNESFIRNDVNDYFACEYDYSKVGFAASVKSRKIDLNNKNYEVLVSCREDKKVVRTETYITSEGIMYVKPEDFVSLNVEGTILEEVIEKGVLRVYRPDFGMYVYQFDGELYWIAEKDYGFVNQDTYISFNINTTQIERLPQERIENNWFWGSEGFAFSEKEIICEDLEEYRVTKCEIPTEYSVAYIWTGNYINDWIWRSFFRPRYEF